MTPARSWQSVCGECAAYRTAHCVHYRSNRSPDDCFAAVCEGFEPGARQVGTVAGEQVDHAD